MPPPPPTVAPPTETPPTPTPSPRPKPPTNTPSPRKPTNTPVPPTNSPSPKPPTETPPTTTPTNTPTSTPTNTPTPVPGPVYEGTPEYTDGSLIYVYQDDPDKLDFQGTDSEGRGCTCGFTKTADKYGNVCFRQNDYWVDSDNPNGQTELECDHAYYYYNFDDGSMYRVPRDRWP